LEKIKGKKKDYISYDEYLRICEIFGLNEERAKWLSQFFHDLGVILHFQDDLILRKTVVLNHEWVTQGVYNVLDCQKVKDNDGVFTDNDLIQVWSDKKYREKHSELLSLMKNDKFEVCFELEPGKYLAPRLLPVDEVEYEWRTLKDNLHFEYRYQFLPKGILTRFIVKRNNDIYNKTYWQYGVLIHYEDTMAIVRERYFNRKITISLEGSNKKEFLGVIRKTLKEIHEDYRNLEYKEMIPCNCKHCQKSKTPHFFEYRELRQYSREGVQTINCRRKKIKPVLVRSLIDDVFVSEKVKINLSTKEETILNKVKEDSLKKNPVNMFFGDIKMKEQNVKFGDGATVTGSPINLGEIRGSLKVIFGQLPENAGNEKYVIKDLLIALENAIEEDAELKDEQKARAFNQLKELAHAAKDPNNQEMKYQAEDAISILEKLAKRLPNAVRFGKACKDILQNVAEIFSF